MTGLTQRILDGHQYIGRHYDRRPQLAIFEQAAQRAGRDATKQGFPAFRKLPVNPTQVIDYHSLNSGDQAIPLT